MRKLIAIIIASLCMAVAVPEVASAKRYVGTVKSYHHGQGKHYARRSLRGFTCGLTQRRHFGISDPKFNLALNWAMFTHTTAQPGAVVVQTRRGRALGGGRGGHVSRIVQVTGHCSAIVLDSRGRPYQRNICKNLVAYVIPGGARTRYPQMAYNTTFNSFRGPEGN